MNKNIIFTIIKRLVLSVILLWTVNGCEKTPSQQTVSELKEVLESVKDYEYGKSRSWLQQYNEVLAKIYNDPTILPEVERLMIQILESDASVPSKMLICKSLGTLATEKSLNAIQKMLLVPETSHMALVSLQPVPIGEVNKLLIETLSELKGESLIGVINVLGIRKAAEAVEAIAPFVQEPDKDVRKAAICALGEIGDEQSINLLYGEFKVSQQEMLAEALIRAIEDKTHDQAQDIYKNIYDVAPSLTLKTSAFMGLLKQKPAGEQAAFLLGVLQSSDPEFHESILQVVRQIPFGVSMDPLIQALPTFSQPVQQNLMLAIADRGEDKVRDFVIRQLSSNDEGVRLAGLKALKSISVAADIPMLAKLAATSGGEEQELARACIYWMDDEAADQSIITAVKSSAGKVKSELLRAIGYRKIDEGLDYTIGQISVKNPEVKRAAIETTGMIGTKEVLNAVKGKALTGKISDQETEVIIDALTRISLNSGDPDWCADQINASFATFSNETPMVILISTLGNIGTDISLNYIRPFLSYDDYDIQFTALKALSTWQKDSPLPDLEEYLKTGENPRNRQMAQVGVVNLVQNSAEMSGDEKAGKLIESFEIAQSTEESVIVLNGISRIYSLLAMEFVISQLNDPDLSSTAREAFVRIADNLKYSYESIVVEKIDSIAENETSEDFKNKLKILKRSIEL